MSTSYSPFISVVIPTFNRTTQTITAIESVLAQTYRHFETIVVDDGSTDGSCEAVQRFATWRMVTSNPLIFLSQPNRGASSARNRGIAQARGEYIAFLDSDDVWLPEKLEFQVQAFDRLRDECGGCVTDARLVNSGGLDVSSFRVHQRRYEQTIGIDRSATISLARSFCGFWISSLLARAETIREIGGFNPDITFAEDRDFHFRLSLITSIAYVNKELIVTDREPSPPGSVCRPWDKLEVQLRQEQNMFEKWLKMDTALPADVRASVERNLGSVHSHWANWYLEKELYDEARQAIFEALKYKITPGTTAKLALTWLAPALARRIAPSTRPVGTGGHAS